MKKTYLYMLLLLGNCGTLLAQNYLAYTKDNTALVDSSNHAPIDHIEKGAAVFLVSEKTDHGYYKVIHLESNKKGLIHSHNLKIHKELPVTRETAKNYIRNPEVKDPVVNIHNSTHHPIIVAIDRTEYEVKPRETKSLNLKKGRCYFKVIADGYEPHYDVEKLQDYHMYDWEFYVEEDHLL